MIVEGKAWKFGDDVSTDLITPGRYFHLRTDLPELARHTLEDADPEFAAKVSPGDVVVAGRNFGLGSSREHAPRVIKLSGAGAVLAQSFARIFYRNAINVGLPVLVCDTSQIDPGDKLEVDVGAGTVKDVTKGIELKAQPLPDVMIKILGDGGLLEHFRKHKGFALED